MTTLLFLVGSVLAAQRETGSLHGLVHVQGDALANATVELTGLGAPRTRTTDARGQFRFLDLDPGGYSLRVELAGFAVVRYPTLEIQVDTSTELRVELRPEIEEEITVDAQTTLLDERQLSQGTHIAREELEAIPTARDPWAILNQAPGVLTDRIDVGGTRATQGSFSAFGTSRRQNDFLLDGVQITDMAGLGGSSTYFDFDQFEEIQVETGGSDVTKVTAGASLNLVTRRGSQQIRGSSRLLRTDDSWQSAPDVSSRDFAPGQDEVATNQLDSLDDLGFEAGGPIVDDRLWLWGAYGLYDIVDLALGGTPQSTEVESFSARLNAQLSEANSAVATWNRTDKKVFDRGAGISRAPETLWQQRGPTPILKVESTHLLSDRLMVSATYSDVDGGFEQIPNAGIGPDAPEVLIDPQGVTRNNFLYRIADRPADELRLTLDAFLSQGSLDHEITVGARRRRFASVGDSPLLPGRQLVHFASEVFGQPPGPVDFLYAERGTGPRTELEYRSLWVQDTIRTGAWTFNVGARYDHQEGTNPPARVDGNPAFPELLPAITFEGNDGGGFDWSTVSPRLGVTYALGKERDTLLRASYSRFADALGTGTVSRVNSLSTAYAYFAFLDRNGNNFWDDRATDGEPILLFAGGFDPTDPSTNSPNINDPDLDPGLTDEWIVGVEHALRPELVLGISATWRRLKDTNVERILVRDGAGLVRPATRDDYDFETSVEAALPDGSLARADVFALQRGLRYTGGTLLTNGANETDYRGVTLTLRKRYSDHWSLRGHVNFGDAELDLPESEAFFDDPTRTGLDVDGDLAVAAGWSFNVNGLVTVAPERWWNFDVAGNVYGREGYPLTYAFDQRSRQDGRLRSVWLVAERDDFRLDDLVTVDLSLQKSFDLRGKLELTVSADLFNALNEATEVSRETRLSRPQADFLLETLSPRIWRFGVRLAWR